MRTTQLRAFDAVARLGGFSRAAGQLALTQPAVTIQVRSLEQDYGVKLFNRRGGVVALTAAGRGLFERTRELFRAEDLIRDYLDQSQSLKTGEVRLAADGPRLAMALIAAFRSQYPGVYLSVALANSAGVWRDLREGRADVGVVANPPNDPRVHVVQLGVRGLEVVLPAGHALAGHKILSLKQLAGQPVIFREAQSNTQKSLERALKRQSVAVDEVMRLASREGLVEAVAADLGIGFVFADEVSANGRVRVVPLRGLEAENRDTVACLNSQKTRNTVAAFLRVAERWRQDPGPPAKQ